MAKGQVRGNKEVRKPKSDKKGKIAPATDASKLGAKTATDKKK